MKKPSPVLLLFLVFLWCRASAELVELHNVNFGKIYDDKHDWFIMFYAPWCGHCRRMESTWKEFAENPGYDVKVGRVDATENWRISRAFGVKGYPTLHFLKKQNNEYHQYKGDRSIKGFKEFLASRDSLQNGEKIPIVGLSYMQQLARTPAKTALIFFTLGGAIALSLVGCLVYFGDGANDKEIAKTLESIKDQKVQEKTESKKDR